MAATGWLPVYSFHVGLYSVVLITTLLRYRLEPRVKAGIMVSTSFVVAAVGHYSFGLMAGGVFYLPIALVVLVFFFELRIVILFGLLCIIGIAAVAMGFIAGTLQTAADPTTMHGTVSQWVNYGFNLTLFLIMTSLLIRGYRSILRGMIDKVAGQRDEILQLTNFDQLTGVATLSLVTDLIEQANSQALADGTKCALLLVSIDKLEEINDELGYDTGDLVLRSVSERLNLLLRPEDKLARIGGSNYLVLIDKLKDESRAKFLAEMISESLCKPIRSGVQDILLESRIGIALFPDGDKDPQQLILKANDARSQARSANLSQFVSS